MGFSRRRFLLASVSLVTLWVLEYVIEQELEQKTFPVLLMSDLERITVLLHSLQKVEIFSFVFDLE
jgi:hypothetical protein